MQLITLPYYEGLNHFAIWPRNLSSPVSMQLFNSTFEHFYYSNHINNQSQLLYFKDFYLKVSCDYFVVPNVKNTEELRQIGVVQLPYYANHFYATFPALDLAEV